MVHIIDPYKILESKDFIPFLKDIGVECITKPHHEVSSGEILFNSVFWGKVGLSGFTTYPKIMNRLVNRELLSLSRQLLSYQFQQIQNGKTFLRELCANLGLFTIIASEMDSIMMEEHALSTVPAFLFRAVKDFSIEKAQISLARENDIRHRYALFHVMSSTLILLGFAYYESEESDLRIYAKEILKAYDTSLNIHEFLYADLTDSLNADNTKDLVHLLDHSSFLEQYIRNIPGKALSNQLEALLQRRSQELVSDAKKYVGGYCFENVLEKDIPYDKAVAEIKNNYFRYICPNYTYLLNTCGKYYDEMMHYNVKKGRWNSLSLYDHKMVYMLAGWLKDNRDYDCLTGISKERLAHEITDHIITYIRNMNKE